MKHDDRDPATGFIYTARKRNMETGYGLFCGYFN